MYSTRTNGSAHATRHVLPATSSIVPVVGEHAPPELFSKLPLENVAAASGSMAASQATVRNLAHSFDPPKCILLFWEPSRVPPSLNLRLITNLLLLCHQRKRIYLKRLAQTKASV